jgi:hypothetical protein
MVLPLLLDGLARDEQGRLVVARLRVLSREPATHRVDGLRVELIDAGLARAELIGEIDEALPVPVVPAHDVQVPIVERRAERFGDGAAAIDALDGLLLGTGLGGGQALLERGPSFSVPDVVEPDDHDRLERRPAILALLVAALGPVLGAELVEDLPPDAGDEIALALLGGPVADVPADRVPETDERRLLQIVPLHAARQLALDGAGDLGGQLPLLRGNTEGADVLRCAHAASVASSALSMAAS